MGYIFIIKMKQENEVLKYMSLAISQAIKANNINEVPVGAIVIQDDKVIGRGFNRVIQKKSVSAHAEIEAINSASKSLNNYRLNDCDLFVTLEPCHMCAKAIVDARIKRLYFGAYEPKSGAIESIDQFLDRDHLNHKVMFSGGHMQEQCSELLRRFFQSRRQKKIS
jgi:tRNA(adenine34) deaminase